MRFQSSLTDLEQRMVQFANESQSDDKDHKRFRNGCNKNIKTTKAHLCVHCCCKFKQIVQ